MPTALSTTITDPASTLVTTVVTAGDAIAGAVGIVAAGSVMAEEWWLSTVADTETAILMETVDTTMTATRAMAEADMTDTLVIMTAEDNGHSRSWRQDNDGYDNSRNYRNGDRTYNYDNGNGRQQMDNRGRGNDNRPSRGFRTESDNHNMNGNGHGNFNNNHGNGHGHFRVGH
jgi:hypothetical protein